MFVKGELIAKAPNTEVSHNAPAGLLRVKLSLQGEGCILSHEQPVVLPQVLHFMQVPLRTMVKEPQVGHGSPS